MVSPDDIQDGGVTLDGDLAPQSPPVLSLIEHLRRELERDYPKAIVNKGRKIDPRGIAVTVAGEEAHGQVLDRGETLRVFMTLPIFAGDRGYSFIKCSCLKDRVVLEDQRCAHMWAVQDRLLGYLEAREKAAASAVPESWEAAFQKVEEKAAVSAGQTSIPAGAAAQRLVWEIGPDLKVAPYLQSLGESGIWSRGRRLGWSEVLSQDSLWKLAPEALAVGARWQALQNESLERHEPDRMAMLRELVGCDRVVRSGQPEARVEVRCGHINLLVERRTETLSVRVQVDGRDGVSWVKTGELGYGIWGDEPPSLTLGVLDETAAPLIHKLVQTPLTVPAEEADKLFHHLVQVESRVPVQLTTPLVATEAIADDRIYLRMTPLVERGLRVEMYYRPSPLGAYFFPGWGSTFVLDTTDPQQPTTIKRDLEEERLVSRRLVRTLDLDEFPSPHDAVWILPRDEDALGLMERLQGLPDKSRVVVEWPKSPSSPAKKWELAEPLATQDIKVTVSDRRDWFDLDGQVAWGDDEVSLRALLEAMRHQRRYVQLESGRWSRITSTFQERLSALAAVIEGDERQLKVSPADIPAWESLLEQDAGLTMAVESDRWQEWQQRFQQGLRHQTADMTLPPNFRAQLRPYQMQGFQWLCQRYEWGLGACLADDMGLGKTVQTLALLLKHQASGPSLVVAPTSVIPNWGREAQKFAPDLRVRFFQEERHGFNPASYSGGDLVLISYGLLWREIDRLQKVPWNVTVMDEAQMLKNSDSITTGAMRTLPARWRLALSGTPLENHLGELWSLFHTLTPGILGTWPDFKRQYAIPIERFNDGRARRRLHEKIGSLVLRRLKEDFLAELPPKTEIDLLVELSGDERRYYDAWRLEAFEKLQQVPTTVAQDNTDAEAETPGGQNDQQQRFQILGMLTKLRQIACDVRLVDQGFGQRSSKTLRLRELVQELRDNQHAVLVFSQFTSYLDFLEQELVDLKIPYGRLDGSCSVQQRQQLVDQFQDGDFDVFLISLKAGGTGLNLTRANYVVHMDPWWNPAAEDQATDRAHRMGQTKPLTVYRLIAGGTVEEKIVQLHRWKRDLLDQVVATTTAGDGPRMSVQDLKALLS